MFGLVVLLLAVLCGCKSAPSGEQRAVPLPEMDAEGRLKPRGVFAVIRKADIAMDQPTDEAWQIINEQAVPALIRGAWRGNGLRVGMLKRDQLDTFAKVMPRPVSYAETLMNMSPHPVPIVETPRLSGDLLFEIDLTRPPKPRHVEEVAGGKNSRLRMLANIEKDDTGRYILVLTPHHYIPEPLDLIPRDPLEKETDGRVYDELTIRIALDSEHVAVVGMYWPWPLVEVVDDEGAAGGTTPGSANGDRVRVTVPPVGAGDPAAPPPHLRGSNTPRDKEGRQTPRKDAGDGDKPDNTDGEPRIERVAPVLPTHFGSTLLTGTRIRQPVRRVLLITIENQGVAEPEPEPDPELEPEADQGASP